MNTKMRQIVFAAIVSVAALLPAPARAQTAIPGPCTPGLLPGGARSLICVPVAGWNGELVVFAHGYVSVDQPPTFADLYLANGDGTYIFLPALVQSLGYAFATTTFRQNGLAILEGAQDIRELVTAFSGSAGFSIPLRTYVAGVSEGGLIATLLAERSPDVFTSALAACGPIGSFRAQIDFVGDFRVLFDYFFPGILPGSPIDIPPGVMTHWQSDYVPAITGALALNPGRALELMRVSKAAYDPSNPSTVVNTTLNLLWYNVFATTDVTLKLGGNPYGNRWRWYFGSTNDLRLNLLVPRFTASPVALAALGAYATSGDLSIPLVTLHTTLDEVVPFWHEVVYAGKADLSGRGRFIPLPIFRYGHCNFRTSEIVKAFLATVQRP